MENEVKELLEEEMETEVGEVNRKPSKAKILGVAVIASVTALLLKFRKKIGSKIEGVMVKKLNKKGYTVLEPVATTEITDAIEETFVENL